MSNFVIRVGLWLVEFITGPAVQAILKSILNKFIQQGKTLIPIVKEAIEEAQTHTELSGTEKLKFAVSLVAAKFPDMEITSIYAVVTAIFEQIYTVPSK
jgi:hypothetical protein